MAGSKTDYYENKILNLMRGEAVDAWTPFIALFVQAPSEDSQGEELSVEGYSRQQVDFSAPEGVDNFTQASNSELVKFGPMVGSGELVSAVGYFDSPTGGNLCYYDDSIVPVTIDAYTVVEMEPGKLKIREN